MNEGQPVRTTQRIFINESSISPHLFCSVCHQVFENPQRLKCGHTFCYACIISWSEYNLVCPLCKDSLMKRKLQPDILARKLVDELKVKCRHQGCIWEGKYEQLKKHQRFCVLKPKNLQRLPQQQSLVQISDGSEDIELISVPQSNQHQSLSNIEEQIQSDLPQDSIKEESQLKFEGQQKM